MKINYDKRMIDEEDEEYNDFLKSDKSTKKMKVTWKENTGHKRIDKNKMKRKEKDVWDCD